MKPTYIFCILILLCLSTTPVFGQVSPMMDPGGGGTPPANPPNPTASTNTCGPKTLTRSGSPPAGTVWLWQTTSNGTSIDNFGATFQAPTSGTYYLRAHKPSADLWSTGAGWVIVTVNPNPAAPAAPSIQHNCWNAVFTRGTPPAGVTWYWQDTNSAGTSTSNSSTTYTASVSGTYYIRSLSSVGCWGSSTAISFTQSQGPADPPAPILTGGCGTANLAFNGTPPQFTRWAWQTSPVGTDLTNMTTNYTVSSSGTYYLRAYDLNTQCWSPSPPSVTVVVTAIPLTPGIPTQNITCGQTTLSHNGNVPAGVTWYWQTVPYGTGTSFATQTYNITTDGNYYLRARTNDANACWSVESSSVNAVFKVKPSPPTAQSVSREEPGIVNLSATVGTNGDEIRWYNQSGELVSEENSYSTVVASTSTFEAASYKNSSFCESDRISVTATVTPKPIVSSTNIYFVLGKPLTLSVPNNSYTTYSWKRNGVEVGTGSTISLTNAPGSYTVTVTKTGMTGSGTSDAINLKAVDMNSVTINNVRKVGFTTPATVESLPATDRIKTIQYSGGLGNPIQTILAKRSADVVSPKDVIVPTEYDVLGRQLKGYLPYVSAASDALYRGFALNNGGYTNSEQYQFYQTQTSINIKIAKDSVPYSITEIEPSPLGRPLANTGVGNNWHIKGKKVTQQYLLNRATDAVRIWTVNASGMPVSTATYPDYQLFVNLTTDENGNRVKVYIDKLGRPILKEVEADATNWLRTYSIYDDFGRLAYTLSPEGTKVGNFTPPQAFLDQWAFQYRYDNRDRLVEHKAPAGGWIYSVYDLLNRPVMTQNADQRSRSEWSFVKYDVNGRAVVTGLKVIASSTRTSVQTSVDAQTYLFELTAAGAVGYTLTRTYPSALEADLLSINYYDNYAFISYTGWNVEAGLSFVFVAEQGSTGYETGVAGLATGAKMKILGSAVWLNAVQYYDNFYRPLQIIAENHLGGLDRNTNKYNDLRQLIETRLAHHNQSVIVLQKYNYDHAGRVTKVYHNINSAPTDQLVAQYEYNELGQLVDKKLHNTTGTTFLQSVDYRYNIRGWIGSINNSQLNVNSANNDETNDYFGMEFVYNRTESGLSNTVRHNGNISAIKWKAFGTAAGTTDQKSYKYLYDKADRLTTATSQMYTGAAWTKEANALNEVMTYDHNGNIKTLQRNHQKHQLTGIVPSYVSETVDNLTYTYSTAQGNQLLKVEDAVAVATGVGDFKNNANIATEYTYNTDGNLTADKNKGIDSVHYNVLGKVRRIKFTDGRVITYFYDAGGNKLKMKNFQGTTLLLTTDYLGGFVYENGVLKFFGSPEGRVVKNGSAFEYQYSLADHQGNTRVVFTAATIAPLAPTATFEGDANDGASQYQNVVAGNVVAFVAANHTTGGTKVLRMNQTTKIAASKSVKVFPGDKVDVEVWEYHEGASGFGTTSTPMTTLITMVSGAFGGVSGGAGESGLIYSGVNSAITAYLPPGNQGAARPAAYLNYILFDKNYKVLNMGWQLAPATTFTKQKLSFSTVNVKEAGYIFVYLSYDNDSNNWVYFDDLKVTHTKSNILQYNEYYPFGLQAATSWTREGSSNNYLYNEGSELNQNSGWYETSFRSYDPTLARFMQIDPLAYVTPSLTPYHYGQNNPVLLNDPSGLFANTIGFSPSVWGMIEEAWSSVWEPAGNGGGGGGMGGSGASGGWSSGGHFEYSNGQLTYSLTYGKVEHEDGSGSYHSWHQTNDPGHNSYFNPNNSQDAEALVMAHAITAIETNDGWAHTAVHSQEGAIKAYKDQTGFDITSVLNGILLKEVTIEDSRMNDNDWQIWLNGAGGVVSTFALGTDLSLKGAKPLYTGAQEWAKQLAAGGKLSTILNYSGKALGVTSTIANGIAVLNDPSLVNYIKFGASVGQLALKSNPVGFLISIGWTAFESSGGVEWAVDKVSNSSPKK